MSRATAVVGQRLLGVFGTALGHALEGLDGVAAELSGLFAVGALALALALHHSAHPVPHLVEVGRLELEHEGDVFGGGLGEVPALHGVAGAVVGVGAGVLEAPLHLDGDFVGRAEVEQLEGAVGVVCADAQEGVHVDAAGPGHAASHPGVTAVGFPLSGLAALVVDVFDGGEAAGVLVDAVAVEVGVFVLVAGALGQVGTRGGAAAVGFGGGERGAQVDTVVAGGGAAAADYSFKCGEDKRRRQ